VLAELLADPEPVARLGAGRGLGDAGRPDATALLRYKILLGDKEPEVIATCLESLLHLGDAFEFCLQLLAAHDDRAEATALALAGRRDPRAFEPIRAWGDSALAEQRRRVAYVALALLRADAATEHLLDVVRSGEQADAFAAAKALAIFKDDPAVVAKLRAAVPAKLRAQLDDLLGR